MIHFVFLRMNNLISKLGDIFQIKDKNLPYEIQFFYRPQTKLREGNVLHLSVCSSGGWLPSMHHRSHDQDGLHRGGGVGQIPLGLPTGEGIGQTPPEIYGILWDTVNKRAVRILLECFPVPISFLTVWD